MLYLIKAQAIENAVAGPPEQVIPLVENVIIPSFKMLVEGERGKKFMGGAIAGRRGWAVIADFPGHEDMNRWVMGMPFWNMQNTEVLPLVSFQSQLDSLSKRMQDVKSMLWQQL